MKEFEKRTGDMLLYLSFIFGAISLGKMYGVSLMTFFGLFALGLALSFKSIVMNFKKENSNAINCQLFWISIFFGVLAFIMMLLK